MADSENKFEGLDNYLLDEQSARSDSHRKQPLQRGRSSEYMHTASSESSFSQIEVPKTLTAAPVVQAVIVADMPANEHCPSIQGKNIFLAGGSVHRQVTKSDSKYSIKLNEVFDKLFELLCSLCQGTSQKLRAVMDLLAQCMA